ncbi:MAG: hypothetical protein CME64_10395 [Halobacteriovoraceae bacterium]|nr:hypothetical protein [Halobacteriovoraceae bacterium]|tara:strand:+ start:9969 stop:10838 length:870 start_codon:yes stop_codon:yes gene_type:complete
MKWRSLFLSILIFGYASAQVKTSEELKDEVIDYSNIQKLLKKDGLEKNAKLKKKIVQQIKVEKEKIKTEKFHYPSKEDFWGFASRMWLVKNAQELKWDVPRPDYGIRERFRKLLEEFGYFNEKFKILIVDSPNIARLGLPSSKNESLFILSLPFMRALDLTKTDISLLLLEDFFRLKEEMFKNNLNVDTSFVGGNFAKSEFNKVALLKVLKAYGEVAYKRGFSFQQQYELTKKMDKVLKSKPEVWNSYFQVLKKIDQLVKNNLMYKNYLKIYPSPELQIQWLSPKKKVL